MLNNSVDKPQKNSYSRETDTTKVPNVSDRYHMLVHDTTML